MKVPPLMDDELRGFLREGLSVAKIVTHNRGLREDPAGLMATHGRGRQHGTARVVIS